MNSARRRPEGAKAVRLARAISGFMNATALTVPAFLIGLVTWLKAIGAQRRHTAHDA